MRLILVLSLGMASLPLGAAIVAPNCLTSKCHSDLIEKRYLHGPVKSKGCTICHQVVASTSPAAIKVQSPDHPVLKKLNPADINKSCFLCHEEYKALLGRAKKIHSAITEQSCTSCHNPHQADQATLLKFEPKKELCLSCHKAMAQKLKTAEFHVIDKMKNACLACHETHASKDNDKLVSAKNVQSLCLNCHKDEVKRTNGKTLQKFSFAKIDEKLVHKPVRDQDCNKCHDIHGSKRPGLLIYEYQNSNPALCYSCHDMQKTEFRNGTLDLHELHLQDTKNKKSCQTCHDTHQSVQGHLVRSEFESRGYQFEMNYKNLKSGGTCATVCHKAFEYNRVKKVSNESDR